jgi:UDP-GlcNAc:undecaprenyl-phosphate/decaprenyl-phosphate GlcNAc-1-phosphate transferase
MRTSAASFLLGFMVAVWLTPLVRRLAFRFQLVDRPKDSRRVNTKAVPRAGGLAIAAGVFAPILALAFYENAISRAIYADMVSFAVLFVGALAALGVGLVDDLYRPSAKLRLVALVLIAAASWLGGHRLGDLVLPGVGQVAIGLWSLPLTVLWIVGVVVAFNFVDGLDGLATGIALISTATLFVYAAFDQNVLLMTWTGAMAGALVGFLIFNFNPASIFMGDAGSNFLGYLLAVVALQTSRKAAISISLAVPLCVLGLPLLDVSLTMIRRALLRQGLFTSERGHLHHRLLALGLSHRWAVLVLWGVTSVFCVGALSIAVPLLHLHVVVAVLITVVMFCLMFATGYVRPSDVLQMYRQGKANEARQQHVELVCRELASCLETSGEGEVDPPWILQELVERGCATAAQYRCERGCETLAGEYDRSAKGTRHIVRKSRDAVASMLVFWKERADDPTPREIAALGKLFAGIECSCKFPKSISEMRTAGTDTACNPQAAHAPAVGAPEKIWTALVESANRLSLVKVQLELSTPLLSEGFNATWEEAPIDPVDLWRLDVPVMFDEDKIGWLRVVGDSSRYSSSRDIAGLLDILDSSQSYLQSILRSRQQVPALVEGVLSDAFAEEQLTRTPLDQGIAGIAGIGEAKNLETAL